VEAEATANCNEIKNLQEVTASRILNLFVNVMTCLVLVLESPGQLGCVYITFNTRSKNELMSDF